MHTSSGPLMVFVALLLILVPSLCLAQAQPLTVVTEEWPPYNYTTHGTPDGVVTDVVRATLNRAGLTYDIKVFPWARAYHMAQEQENVLIYTIFKLDNRRDKFQWIKIEGLSTEMYLFSPSGRHDIVADTIEKAKKYRVGVTRETSTHQFLRNQGFIENMNLFTVSSERQNILQADANVRHIDLTTGDRLSMAHWLSVSGYPTDYLHEEAFLFKEDFYMAFSLKTDPAVVNRVRRAFKDIRNDGTLDWILNQYHSLYGLEYAE